MGLIVLPLEMHDIQGDLLVGMQKNAELFLFLELPTRVVSRTLPNVS
jgi:hypothetical protein